MLAIATAVTVPLSGCFACTTIGYVNNSPAIIELNTALPADHSISACFGESCSVAPLASEDGYRWTVPQEPPYLVEGDLALGAKGPLRVVIADEAGELVIDDHYEIPIMAERAGWLRQCPGPVSFAPLEIEFAG